MKSLRVFIGLAAWCASSVLLFLLVRGFLLDERSEGHQVASDLWEFASAERRFVSMQLEQNWPLAVGDPIYRVDGPDAIEQVGEIRRVVLSEGSESLEGATGPLVEALLYPNAPPVHGDSYLEYFATPRSLSWVMETMLPQEKRILIAEEILATYEKYHSEILDAVKPVVVAGFLDALQVVEQDLGEALERQHGELERLGGRYQDGVVSQEIVPLIREEIVPIVQRHAEPLANQIGEELFERASIWRFGWRLIYDKSFLPQKNLTQAEWTRFVNEEGIPALNRYRDDIVAVQRRILEDIAANEEVRVAVRRNLSRVIDDPEFRGIVWQIFRDVLIDNPRLRDKLEQRWNTTEARRAVQLASGYVEPCVRRIGDLLFGTREAGIAPQFAQVLRNQILDKDCRWLVIKTPESDRPATGHPEGAILRVRHGGYPDVNPFAVQLQGGF
jgi:hypothetical protein